MQNSSGGSSVLAGRCNGSISAAFAAYPLITDSTRIASTWRRNGKNTNKGDDQVETPPLSECRRYTDIVVSDTPVTLSQ